jgi:putative hydrolase of the HAD superfamily
VSIASSRGVLFDLDNTLTHRGLSIAAYARRFTLDFARRLEAPDDSLVARLIDERDNGGYGVKDSAFSTLRDDVGGALATRLAWRLAPTHADLVEHWLTHFPTQSVEMPGATALIERLHDAGYALGIVSNGMDASRRALVRHLGFDRFVRTVLSSERAGAKKPDPRIFELAAAEIGVPPERCWFVGDHPVNDIAGARTAGMRAAWLSGFHSPVEGIEAHATIASLAGLEAVLFSATT